MGSTSVKVRGPESPPTCGGGVTRFLFGTRPGVDIEGAARGGAGSHRGVRALKCGAVRMPSETGVLKKSLRVGLAILAAASLAACASNSAPKTFDGQEPQGFNPFSVFEGGSGGGDRPAVSVNGYLWRAALDTLSFMPLSSADPYGGVIITDWYVNPEKPDERFKATVYILDSRLRADGLNVAIFRQVRDAKGTWTEAQVNAQTEVDVENAILTRARQVRLSSAPG